MILRLNPKDNIGVARAAAGLEKGDVIENGIVVKGKVDQGHKIALEPISEGEAVLRYGHVIGYALRGISPGTPITKEDLRIPEPPALDDISYHPVSNYHPVPSG